MKRLDCLPAASKTEKAAQIEAEPTWHAFLKGRKKSVSLLGKEGAGVSTRCIAFFLDKKWSFSDPKIMDSAIVK